MTPELIESSRGFAKREPNFAAVLEAAQTYEGSDLTSARVISLLANVGRITFERDGETRRLSPAAKLVAIHLLTYIKTSAWSKGHAMAWPSNDRIAASTDLSVRTVQGALRDLEAAGLTLRRYNGRNARLEHAGIDFRPTAVRIEEIAATVEDVVAEVAERRAATREERHDVLARRKDSCRDESFANQEYNAEDLLKKCTESGGYVDPEDEKARSLLTAPDGAGERRSTWIGRDAADTAAPHGANSYHAPEADGKDDAWLFLDRLAEPQTLNLLTASQSFCHRLKEVTQRKDVTHATAHEILSTITDLRTKYLPQLSPTNWQHALRRHGHLAIVALLVTIDRDGVKDRVKYFQGIVRRQPDDPQFDPVASLRALRRH